MLQERAVDVLAFSPSAGKLTVAVLVEQYIFASQVVSELWVECGDGSPGPTESDCDAGLSHSNVGCSSSSLPIWT